MISSLPGLSYKGGNLILQLAGTRSELADARAMYRVPGMSNGKFLRCGLFYYLISQLGSYAV